MGFFRLPFIRTRQQDDVVHGVPAEPLANADGRMPLHLNTDVNKENSRPLVNTDLVTPSTGYAGSPETPVQKEGDFTGNRPVDPMLGGDVHYKSMSWWHAGMLMIAETVSLGILALPWCLARLGLVPGIITIFVMGCLATYTGYVIGQFKMRHVQVYSMADAGEVLFGRIGREIFGVTSTLMFICYMAAHILTFSICFNVLTDHATCTLVFGVAGFIISFILTIPRTLKKVSYQSIGSFASIGIAVLITMIALGVTKEGGKDIEAIGSKAELSLVVTATMDIVMAYAGNVAFFSFISELAEPQSFPKALALLQSVTITIYIVVAVVIYYYGGPNIPSPALGATSPIVRKVAYGIAIPTIIVAGVINAHIAAKYIYLRVARRGTPPLYQQKSFWAWAIWLIIVASIWFLAFIVASAVPNFNDLLALISALFGTWFTYGIPGYLWIWMNWSMVKGIFRGKYPGWRKLVLLAVNLFLIIFAGVMCVGGMYYSIKKFTSDEGGKAFACENNAKV